MPRGRPRQFDRNEALARAMEVFWGRGYHDASISQLAAAMGIGSASLYAAYGSKGALFQEAADRYQVVDAAPTTDALARGSTAREAVEGWLRANADLFTRRGRARGCLLTRAVSTCPSQDTAVARYLERSCRDRIQAVEDRLQQAVDWGEAPPSIAPAELAALLDTVLQGMAVRAMEGAPRRSLHRTIDLVLDAWLPPEPAAERHPT